MNILLVAGGTGGHVFPALSAGGELLQHGRCEVVLLLDKRGKRFYSDAYNEVFQECHVLCDIQMSMQKVLLLFLSICVVFKSLFVILRHRPDVVIGFGGICTIIPLMCCKVLNWFRLCHIKIVAHEQNAVLGRANRFLRRYVDVLASHYPMKESNAYVRIPIRSNDMFLCGKRRDDLQWAPTHRDVCFDDVTIVVFGGSQGADVFDEALPQALSLLSDEELSRLFIYQQTNKPQYLEERYDRLRVRHCLRSFFVDAIDLMIEADVVICRAGASSLAEVMYLSKACIAVPYPHASDDHQERNAQFFVDNNALLCVSQSDPQYVVQLSEYIRFFMDEKNREIYSQQMYRVFDEIDYVTFLDLCRRCGND